MNAMPGPVYGLQVPPGELLMPAAVDFKASFRITMAAIDPTAQPEPDANGNIPDIPRSTLRLVKRAFPALDDGDSDDELDEEQMKALLGESDEDSDEEAEEANGGPSNPSKSKKKDSIKQLIAAAQQEEDDSEEDEDMADAKPNGVSKSGKNKGKGKGKGKAVAEEDSEEDEDDDEDDDSDDDEDLDLEDFVICTLDTQKNYQQPLDINVNHGEKVFFVVSGSLPVFLTGNYIMDDDDYEDDEDDDEQDYDLSPDELDYMVGEEDDEDESDELDDIDGPRVTEIEVEEEEAPALVPVKKGKNKRAAEEAESLDDLIAKSGEEQLSKKQQKKLKNNKGEAVGAEESKKDSKSDKKVQFAKNLEQGPSGSAEKAKQTNGKSVGVKVVQGVTVDDRTIGKGRTVKNGDTVGVRYIGKLPDGKQFDANKKGKPFSFKVGKGAVIKGWDIGVVGMGIGGERRLTIPAHLAYGSKALPGIPANSQLTFDVKLLEIK